MTISSTTSSRWARPLRRPLQSIANHWSTPGEVRSASASPWGIAEQTNTDRGSNWDTVPIKDDGMVSPWGTAEGFEADSANAWQQLIPRDAAMVPRWDHVVPKQSRLRINFSPLPPPKEAEMGVAHQRSAEFDVYRDTARIIAASLYVPTKALDFNFKGERYSAGTVSQVFFDFRYAPPAQAIRPVDSGSASLYGKARPLSLLLQIRWGWGRVLDGELTGIKYPDDPGTTPVTPPDPPTEPEVRESYMIHNQTTLTVGDDIPVFATNLRVSLDIDSFSWAFSADLEGIPSLTLVRPDHNGPKTVHLDMNGHKWSFIVEKFTRNKALGKESFTISGSSQSQLLTAPYANATSGTNTVAINAQQVMNGALENTGFSVDWNTSYVPDWTITVGALTYTQQTPLQLIAKLAEAAGGIVSPHPTELKLTINPRYRYAVWDWSEAISDLILDGSIIETLGGEWSPNPAWDSCYVSGTNTGVSVMVKRNGKDGSNPAPDVYDDLITDSTMGAYRGKAEICRGGDVEQVSLVIPLFQKGVVGYPGLVTPGMLCSVREPGDPWVGLCLSVELSSSGVGASRIEQTLKFERHTSEI